MAEVGIVASVISIADIGLRLSIRLYTVGEIISTADKSVISISKDVSLTSSVLKELGDLLENDKQSQIFSKNAVQTADTVVKECLEVFQEMEGILVKKLPNLSGRIGSEAGGDMKTKASALLERMKWGYVQPKLQLLRSNLDRLKSTLLLMLNVITYARQIAGKSEAPSVIEDQRSLIEDLARSNQEYMRAFEQMKLGIDTNPSAESNSIHEDRKEDGSPLPQGQNMQTGIRSTVPHSQQFSKPSVNSDNAFITSNVQSPFTSRGLQPNKSQGEDVTAPSSENTLFSHLKHYLDLVNVLLNEVDEIKYEIRLDSRDRVRTIICQAYQHEMSQLNISHDSADITLTQLKLAPLVAGIKRRLEQVDAGGEQNIERVKTSSMTQARGPSSQASYTAATRKSQALEASKESQPGSPVEVIRQGYSREEIDTGTETERYEMESFEMELSEMESLEMELPELELPPITVGVDDFHYINGGAIPDKEKEAIGSSEMAFESAEISLSMSGRRSNIVDELVALWTIVPPGRL